MPTAPPALRKYWLNNGPYLNDAEANAIHHLKRYNFRIERGEIFPPVGFELSKEIGCERGGVSGHGLGLRLPPEARGRRKE